MKLHWIALGLLAFGSTRATGRYGPWELYDLEADRSEVDDLAWKVPEKVAELEPQSKEWADRVGVKPWPQGEGMPEAEPRPPGGRVDARPAEISD